MEPGIPHLDLLHLLLIGGVHLLQGLLQLLVPLQQSLPQLRRQVQVWGKGGGGKQNRVRTAESPR